MTCADPLLDNHVVISEHRKSDYLGTRKCLWGLLRKLFSILFYPITLEGRWGTTDEFATIPFHLDLFSAGKVHSCPLFDIVFPPLLLSASFSFSFHCAL